MKYVFADAFYYIALLNSNDQHHLWATDIANRLPAAIVTSQAVVIESVDALSTTKLRGLAYRFFRQLAHDPRTTIVDLKTRSTAHLNFMAHDRTRTGRSPTASALS